MPSGESESLEEEKRIFSSSRHLFFISNKSTLFRLLKLDIFLYQQFTFTMKASAISLPLPLFSLFASLSSSLSIRDLLPRQGEEIKDLASTTIWPPEKPPPVDDVTFSWCQTYNQSDTCFSRDLKHGWCCKSACIGLIAWF